jgi:hypothetical protein
MAGSRNSFLPSDTSLERTGSFSKQNNITQAKTLKPSSLLCSWPSMQTIQVRLITSLWHWVLMCLELIEEHSQSVSSLNDTNPLITFCEICIAKLILANGRAVIMLTFIMNKLHDSISNRRSRNAWTRVNSSLRYNDWHAHSRMMDTIQTSNSRQAQEVSYSSLAPHNCHYKFVQSHS